MSTFNQDLRLAARTLLKRRGFTAAALLSLALGIGATTTVFTLVNAVLLRSLPVRDPERLLAIYGSDQNASSSTGMTYLPTSYLNFQDLAAQSKTLDGVAAHGWLSASLAGQGEPERLFGYIVTTNYFDVLGITPALGRTFLPEDDTAPVMVLSHVAWRNRFGSDPGVIGRTLLLNNQRFTVIGVAPQGFKGTANIGSPQLWVPMGIHAQVYPLSQYMSQRRWRLLNVVGRLAPSATVDQARSELENIAARLEKDYPADNKGRGIRVLTLSETTINPDQRNTYRRAGTLLMSAVALVLLIACINVANLLLARATTRHHEIALRLSLGASRSRIIRQLLTESLLLALAGGVLGVTLAYWGKDLLWKFRPPFLSAESVDLGLDLRVLAFGLAVSLLTGLLFGLTPALQASRPRLFTFLMDRGGGARTRQFNTRNMLAVFQIALSTVALVGAGLFVHSLRNAQRIDLGFNGENLLTMTFDLGAQGYDEARGRSLQERLLAEAQSLPKVAGATLAENPPLDPAAGLLRSVAVEGREVAESGGGTLVRTNSVAPNYLEVIGIPLLRGRGFGPTDRNGSPPVAIINETLAKRLWPGEDPLGQRILFVGEEAPIEVIGVARDSKYTAVNADPQPYAYLSLVQRYSPAVTLHARADGPAEALLEPLRQRVRTLDPNLPAINPGPVSERIAASLWGPRMGAALLSLFGLLSLVLAAIGLYGLMAYSVAQRNREIGIRMSLGAQRRDVLGMILRQSLVIAGAGVLLGVLGALAGDRLVHSMLYGVESANPQLLLGVALLLALVVVLAALVPARRASRVNPVMVLRSE